jgi:hypothetical protein
LHERLKSGLCFRVVRDPIHQHADAPDLFCLLRARGERPRCRAAEQRYELTSLQLIKLHVLPLAWECVTA